MMRKLQLIKRKRDRRDADFEIFSGDNVFAQLIDANHRRIDRVAALLRRYEPVTLPRLALLCWIRVPLSTKYDSLPYEKSSRANKVSTLSADEKLIKSNFLRMMAAWSFRPIVPSYI